MKSTTLSLVAASLAAVSSFAFADAPPAAPPDISAEIAAAPAYVELKEGSWRFERYESAVTVKKRVKINTAEGAAVANQRIVSYQGDDEYFWHLVSFSARTIKPDGTVVEVGPDLRHDATEPVKKDVARHVLTWTFPAVEAGATLEWEYEMRRGYALPWPWWEIQESLPVKEARFTVYGKRISCQHPDVQGYSRSAVAPWCSPEGDVGSEGEFDVFRFRCTQVPAFRREPLSPPDHDLRLRMLFTGTFKDVIPDHEWGRWTDQVRSRLAAFPFWRRNARALAKAEFSSGTTQERVEKIGWWIKKNIQIVDGPAGGEYLDKLNGNADEMLETRRGTATEALMLTRILALEAGLKSYFVMVADGTDETFRPDLPDFTQGRHYVVEVIDNGARWYLDPSCRRCRPAILEWRYAGGRNAGMRHQDDLKVLEGTREVPVDVPPSPANVNVLSRRERIELAADGKGKVAGEATWGGQPEQELRDAWADAKAERRAEEFLKDEPGALSEAKVETGDVNDLSVPYAVKYAFAQGDAALASGGKLVVRPRDVVAKRLGLPIDEERRFPLWWPRPFSVVVEETFVAPEGFKAGALPEAKKLSGPGLTFEGAWRVGSKPNELVYAAKVAVEKTKIPLKDYPAARAFALELRKALAAEATFEGK